MIERWRNRFFFRLKSSRREGLLKRREKRVARGSKQRKEEGNYNNKRKEIKIGGQGLEYDCMIKILIPSSCDRDQMRLPWNLTKCTTPIRTVSHQFLLRILSLAAILLALCPHLSTTHPTVSSHQMSSQPDSQNGLPQCFTPSTIPFEPSELEIPTRQDCRAAANLLAREHDASRVSVITSDSRKVPQGGFLYPHAWTHRSCTVVVGFRRGEDTDQSMLVAMAGRANMVVRDCWHWVGMEIEGEGNSRSLGGQIRGGLDHRLVISVMGVFKDLNYPPDAGGGNGTARIRMPVSRVETQRK